MAFPDIFGQKKKDSAEPAPAPKRDAPAWLSDAEENEKPAAPLVTAVREPAAAVESAESLEELTERLEKLDKLMNQTKGQLLSYLVHRDSQSGSADSGKLVGDQFEGLVEKLVAFGRTLDAIYGKVDQLANAAPRGAATGAGAGDGGGPGLSEAALKAAVRPVGEKIEQFEAKLKPIDGLKEAVAAAMTKLRDSHADTMTKLRDAHAEQHNAQSAAIRQLGEMMSPYFNAMAQYLPAIQQQVVASQQHADAGLRAILEILRPPQQETAPAEPAVGGDWQEALLGGELAHNPALNADKNKLLNGVLTSDPGACGLVGCLLLFRAAAADKMPPLLKDIGEAFYRWQPKTSGRPSEFEKALVEWLMRACDQAGMANTIELVNPGERFDSGRHNASRPGVEITQVLGWIVLRDNGKVYTKASVAVK